MAQELGNVITIDASKLPAGMTADQAVKAAVAWQKSMDYTKKRDKAVALAVGDLKVKFPKEYEVFLTGRLKAAGLERKKSRA